MERLVNLIITLEALINYIGENQVNMIDETKERIARLSALREIETEISIDQVNWHGLFERARQRNNLRGFQGEQEYMMNNQIMNNVWRQLNANEINDWDTYEATYIGDGKFTINDK